MGYGPQVRKESDRSAGTKQARVMVTQLCEHTKKALNCMP